jgi:hypothetical protein
MQEVSRGKWRLYDVIETSDLHLATTLTIDSGPKVDGGGGTGKEARKHETRRLNLGTRTLFIGCRQKRL